MRGFKLLSGDINPQTVSLRTANSWRFVFDSENSTELLNNNHVVSGTYQGIHDFLSTFPDGYIVMVVSIEGPSDIIHFNSGQYDYGWGFNILEDSLQITFLSF